ncbi:hypothetical protein B5C34_05165 [Pacificimonas flava]|uniref:Uncharacterized protein n=2 Tax=Pacificimonas TaxID=1960290 RepID=A0A219B3Q9_9SPHN|nr:MULTISPECIES: hypothetical protein [Pacificimonas]MBZ6377392.1 hypothetical protein [Pacificimonas aurantium]OWV32901.1 hypothetical protein B5C34_05165 [Pacificimonas flava]
MTQVATEIGSTTTGLAGIFASAENLAGIALFSLLFVTICSMVLVVAIARLWRGAAKDNREAARLLAGELDESDRIHSQAISGILAELAAIKEHVRGTARA